MATTPKEKTQSVINSHLKFFSRAPAPLIKLSSDLFYLTGDLFSFGRILLAFSRIFKSLGQRLSIVPRDDDIFIVSYPRSGTTWLQMILYQLTTDGEMDFQHISQVVPFLERTPIRRRDMEKLPSPRKFKTHLAASLMDPRRGRYIYISRSVFDVAKSYYHLYMSYKRQTGSIEYIRGTDENLDLFLKRFAKGRVMYGSWKKHVEGWRAMRGHSNILYLRYEDLLVNFDSTLSQIMQFLDIQLDGKQLTRVRARCSFEFMKRFEAKFEPTSEEIWENDYAEGKFIRNGGVEEAFTLTPAQKQILANLESSAASSDPEAREDIDRDPGRVARRVNS